jgi:hypothetical protein
MRTSLKIFGDSSTNAYKVTFFKARKRLAEAVALTVGSAWQVAVALKL